jgi:hypothetical protein
MATRGGRYLGDSFIAGADLRTKQYYTVELTSTEKNVNVTSAATDIGLGVLQNKPNTGEAASLVMVGVTPAVVDGSGTAIGIGDWLGPNNAGKLVKKATADYSVCARALQASTGSADVIEVLFFPAGFFRTAGG